MLLLRYTRTRTHEGVVEAIRMVERGDATPEDVDQAMELGAGYRELPFSRPWDVSSQYFVTAMGVSCH